MEFLVVNKTKYMSGAHPTTMLINEYVNARLGDYGPAVKEVEVALLYQPSRVVGPPADPFDAEFRRVVGLSPRVTFYRATRRVEVRSVCAGVGPRSIQGAGHLTPAKVALVVTAVSEALELLRPRFRPADQFDVES